MFERLENYYTQNIRIDLTSAERLATLNPDVVEYRKAAKNKNYVVSVLQGDVQEGVRRIAMKRQDFTVNDATAEGLLQRLFPLQADAASCTKHGTESQ